MKTFTITILTLFLLYNIWGIIFGLNLCLSQSGSTPDSCLIALPNHLADWNNNIIVFCSVMFEQLTVFIGGIMVKFQI